MKTHNFASRRRFLAGASLAAVAAPAADLTVQASFPSHPPELAKEMVGVSHNTPARVRELLASRPVLANAAWDWGFGDWETALGAASHVGNREIAEMLLANGAYPTLFSETMLGHLDAVKAMIAARPGIERTTGPHSISLLAHARAGGKQSEEVFRYLESLGTATGLTAQEITEEDLAKFTGEYTFGGDDRIDITQKGKQLTFTRKNGTGRPIHYIGDRTFRPAGAKDVRIRFGEDSVLTVHDGDLVLKASRR